MARRNVPGVFCLEGDWDPDIRGRQSVEPMLELLSDCGAAQFVHRDVATLAELEHYLDRWLGRGLANFTVGYLGFHGSARTLHLSQTEAVTLDQVADAIDGRCKDKILYFGACATLAVKDSELKDFCRRTGARGVVGYTKTVGYIESVSFELILLTELLYASNFKSVYTRLRKEHPHVTRNLGLRMAHGTWASDRSILA